MASSLREFIRARDAGGIVRFLTVDDSVSPLTTALTLVDPAPIASYEELFLGPVPDFFTFQDTARAPWHLQISAGGALQISDASVTNMSGSGQTGLVLRGATFNTFTYVVSTLGVLSITQVAGLPDYVNFSSQINYCREHGGLPYRPDERIYPFSSTHCPKGRHVLVSWSDWINGRTEDFEDFREAEEIW